MQQQFMKKLHLASLGLFLAVLFFLPQVQLKAADPLTATGTTTGTSEITATGTANGTTEAVPPAPAGEAEKSISAFLCTPDITIYNCVNRLYRFGIVAGFFIAVVMIVIAGYMYMTGGEKGKERGKSYISSTFVAIVILLTSYMLLNQINPELTKFKKIQPLDVNDEKLKDLIKPEDLEFYEDGKLNVPGATPTGPVAQGCAGTVVTIPQDEFQQYDTNRTCSTTLDALRRLAQQTNAAGIQFRVNDSIGDGHKSQCHLVSGTCVDIGLGANTTYDQLCKVIKTSGLFKILNESQQTTTNCGPAVNLGNKPHLHIILLAA